MFDTPSQKRSTGNRGAIRKLKHKGNPRLKKNKFETRVKLSISHSLSERPQEVNAAMTEALRDEPLEIISNNGRTWSRVLFSSAHHHWARVTNENTNRLRFWDRAASFFFLR